MYSTKYTPFFRFAEFILVYSTYKKEHRGPFTDYNKIDKFNAIASATVIMRIIVVIVVNCEVIGIDRSIDQSINQYQSIDDHEN